MSHVAVQETKAGEPMFADLEALQMAARMCGLRLVERSTYHWYGRHVGDYPLPPGMSADELGRNARFVLEADPERFADYGLPPHARPYDLGLVEDPNNPGAFVPVYDFWAEGMGLHRFIGPPVRDEHGRPVLLAPRLKQAYDVACDVLAARAAGDQIVVMTAKEAATRFPDLFPPTDDADTWVSVVTGERLDRLAAGG